MSAKASDSPQNVLQWLLERGEQTVHQMLEELRGRPGMTDGIAKVAKRAIQTKGRVDQNLETMLHLLNLPSRADYHKLLVKIEHLQGSIVNLNIKLDRLLAAQHAPKKKTPRAPGA